MNPARSFNERASATLPHRQVFGVQRKCGSDGRKRMKQNRPFSDHQMLPRDDQIDFAVRRE